ncbi:MAG TPA: phage tail tube protein [Isosphaeraceae bacterium]|nr:phage tail tube protein [Isosphaeraceae bacterium]
MSREYLCIVPESSFGTPVAATPSVGTPYTYNANATTPNVFYARLDGGNAFSMRPRPVMVTVPYGGGVAVDAFRVSDKTALTGKLTVKLYSGANVAAGTPGLGGFLMSWAAQQVTAAQTAPWTTTEPPGDLASCSIYHAVQYGVPTLWTTPYRMRTYAGCKVDAWDIDVSEDGTIATLSLDITGGTVGTDLVAATFPAPSEVQIPINPYVFTQATLTIGGSRLQFQNVKISGRNVLAKRFWNQKYAQLQRFVGRSTTVQAVNFLRQVPYVGASNDDRTTYEALTAQTVSFALTNTYHSITATLNTANVITSVDDQLNLNDLYTESITATNQWDPAASPTDTAYWKDLTVTLGNP